MVPKSILCDFALKNWGLLKFYYRIDSKRSFRWILCAFELILDNLSFIFIPKWSCYLYPTPRLWMAILCEHPTNRLKYFWSYRHFCALNWGYMSHFNIQFLRVFRLITFDTGSTFKIFKILDTFEKSHRVLSDKLYWKVYWHLQYQEKPIMLIAEVTFKLVWRSWEKSG